MTHGYILPAYPPRSKVLPRRLLLIIHNALFTIRLLHTRRLALDLAHLEHCYRDKPRRVEHGRKHAVRSQRPAGEPAVCVPDADAAVDAAEDQHRSAPPDVDVGHEVAGAAGFEDQMVRPAGEGHDEEGRDDGEPDLVVRWARGAGGPELGGLAGLGWGGVGSWLTRPSSLASQAPMPRPARAMV